MLKIRKPSDVKQMGTILSVWAHPDDETFCAGGLLAAAVQNGQKVICVTATRGEAGVQDEERWPRARLGEIRQKELQASLKILGIKEHHFLGYKDGDCHRISETEASKRIKAFIEKYQPDSIITFGPDGLTGHEDHQAVSRWVSSAAKGTNTKVYHKVEEAKMFETYMQPFDKQFNLYFNTAQPPVFKAHECAIALTLTPKLERKKLAALEAQPSQTSAMFKPESRDLLAHSLGSEYFILVK